jgi:hypothetical protein
MTTEYPQPKTNTRRYRMKERLLSTTDIAVIAGYTRGGLHAIAQRGEMPFEPATRTRGGYPLYEDTAELREWCRKIQESKLSSRRRSMLNSEPPTETSPNPEHNGHDGLPEILLSGGPYSCNTENGKAHWRVIGYVMANGEALPIYSPGPAHSPASDT